MVDNSKLNPQGGPLSLEEWKRQNEASLTGLTEEQILEKYKEYEQSFKGAQLPGTQTTPQFDDNTNKTQTTEIQKEQPANNVDLMGATDALTSIGISTGNETITKAGILGNSTVKAIKQIQATKGLKGINKTAGVSGAVGGLADTADQMFFGDQAAKNSDLTNTINSGYDMASSAIMTMGPYGAIIGGAMKLGGLLSDGLTALGVGTDQMTTTDQILDSKFLKLTPAGLINGIGASTSDKFSVDNSIREQIGGSYKGAYSFMDNAASRANKKYGLFSSGARDDANRDIAKSKVMQGQIGRISKNASDARSIVSANNQLLSTNYQFNLAGGYDQRYMRAAKEGGKLERIKKINLTFKKGGQIHNVINLETKEIEWKPILIEEVQEFKVGGNINQQHDTWEPPIINDEWEPTIVDVFKEGGSIEEGWKPTIKEDWQEVEYMKEGDKVKKTERKYKTYEDFIKYLGERGKSNDYDYEGFYGDNDAYFEWEDMEDRKPGKAHFTDKYKLPNHITFSTGSKYSNSYTKGGEWFEDDNGINYRTSPYVEKLHSLEEMIRYFRQNEPGVNLIYDGMLIPAISPEPFTPEEFKEGGKTEESKEEPLSNQQNVIPEGALHARKHHMENTEGLTQKGIPVIDNKGEQQAEIELNEIIFNLEVTKKLEELCEDGSDEAAIEAGKLLVQEILFNTEDRTGLIKTLKQGGTINGSTE